MIFKDFSAPLQVNKSSLCSPTDCGVGEEERGSRAEARKENLPGLLWRLRSSPKTRRWRLTLPGPLSVHDPAVLHAVRRRWSQSLTANRGGRSTASWLQEGGASSCWMLKAEHPAVWVLVRLQHVSQKRISFQSANIGRCIYWLHDSTYCWTCRRVHRHKRELSY